jgi:hypothetical protein
LLDSSTDQDAAIRIAALKAAKDAAEHMVKLSTPSNSGSAGAFALYTWGSLAFMSTLFALAIGFYPNSMHFEQATIANIVSYWGNSAPEKLVQVDSLPSNYPIPEYMVYGYDPIPADMDLNVAEPFVVTVQDELPPEPLQITPDGQGKLATGRKTEPDGMSTGSVDPEIQSGYQPFPRDNLPQQAFAVDLGGAKAVSPLVKRFSALKRRAPDLFSDIEPRIQLKGSSSSLQARLIAGPFVSEGEVALFCRAIRLRLTIDCSQSLFDGESIQ